MKRMWGASKRIIGPGACVCWAKRNFGPGVCHGASDTLPLQRLQTSLCMRTPSLLDRRGCEHDFPRSQPPQASPSPVVRLKCHVNRTGALWAWPLVEEEGSLSGYWSELSPDQLLCIVTAQRHRTDPLRGLRGVGWVAGSCPPCFQDCQGTVACGGNPPWGR